MGEDGTERRVNPRAIAERHGVSAEAVEHLARALATGHGNMAQFDHPELGGLGQWSRGGMIMVGRMNDHALKARVDALCTELAATLPLPETHGVPGAGNWWPEGLGVPSSVGAQDGTRYAFFPDPAARRRDRRADQALRSRRAGRDRRVAAAGRGRFVPVQRPGGQFRPGRPDAGRSRSAGGERYPAGAAGRTVSGAPARAGPRLASGAAVAAPAHASPSGADETLTILERLAELHRKGVLTDAEFAQKKAELLARL